MCDILSSRNNFSYDSRANFSLSLSLIRTCLGTPKDGTITKLRSPSATRLLRVGASNCGFTKSFPVGILKSMMCRYMLMHSLANLAFIVLPITTTQ